MKPPSTELFFYLLEIIPLKTNFKGGGRKFTEFACFPFGFEGRIWDLIVSVPDHCLSFYFSDNRAKKTCMCILTLYTSLKLVKECFYLKITVMLMI